MGEHICALSMKFLQAVWRESIPVHCGKSERLVEKNQNQEGEWQPGGNWKILDSDGWKNTECTWGRIDRVPHKKGSGNKDHSLFIMSTTRNLCFYEFIAYLSYGVNGRGGIWTLQAALASAIVLSLYGSSQEMLIPCLSLPFQAYGMLDYIGTSCEC